MVKLKKRTETQKDNYNNEYFVGKRYTREFSTNENEDKIIIKSIYEFLVENSYDGELVKNERGGYDFISS